MTCARASSGVSQRNGIITRSNKRTLATDNLGNTTGNLYDATGFYGTDTIRVISKGKA